MAADARVAEIQERIKVAVAEEDYIKAAALKEQLQAAKAAASAAFERAHAETLNNLKQCEGELQAAKELVAAAKDLVENQKATLAERVAALKVARSEMKAAVDVENYPAAAKLKKVRDEAEAKERNAREASVLARKELAEAQKGERELLSRHNGLNKLLSAAGEEPSREKATKGFSFKSRAKKPAATGYARISASGYTRLTDEADDGSVNGAAPVDADDGSVIVAAPAASQLLEQPGSSHDPAEEERGMAVEVLSRDGLAPAAAPSAGSKTRGQVCSLVHALILVAAFWFAAFQVLDSVPPSSRGGELPGEAIFLQRTREWAGLCVERADAVFTAIAASPVGREAHQLGAAASSTEAGVWLGDEAREAEAWLGAEAQEAETWLEAEARQLDAAHS